MMFRIALGYSRDCGDGRRLAVRPDVRTPSTPPGDVATIARMRTALALLLFVASAAAAQDRLQSRDLLNLRSVITVALSPVSKTIAAGVTEAETPVEVVSVVPPDEHPAATATLATATHDATRRVIVERFTIVSFIIRSSPSRL